MKLPARTGWLSGGNVDAVKEVGRGDHEDDRAQALLVIVAGGPFPDLVGNRVGTISETSGRLSQDSRCLP